MCKKVVYVLLLLSISVIADAQKKPNVLFIGVDDMSIAFDAFGNYDVKAPNFARLLKHGMLFRQTYCQYAMCNPSRTSLLSGKRPDATGVTANETSMRVKVGASYKFLPEYFRANNYYTERFGKVSCDHEDELTWDSVFDIKAQHFKVAGTPIWWIDTLNKTAAENVTGKITAALVKQMKQTVSTPFFYALGLNTHNPYTPTLQAWNKVGDNATQQLLPVDNLGTITNVRGNGGDNIHLPLTPANDTADIPEIAINKELLRYTRDEWRNFRHAYYSEVTQMDDQLGMVLDEIDRQNLWSNTIVVFWSDHGIHLGEHQGLWLKKTIFEESLRVPFVICAPGKPAGVCNTVVELVDIFPTLAELCGLPKPGGQEGTSLVPLLNNPKLQWKRAVFAQVTRPVEHGFIEARAVRTNKYHYNNWQGYGEELYNIETDPYEYNNLVSNPAYADVLKRMRNIYADGWQNALPPAGGRLLTYYSEDEATESKTTNINGKPAPKKE